jgi:hypothetical protein
MTTTLVGVCRSGKDSCGFTACSRIMAVEVVTMEQEPSEEVFSAEMEAHVCELVLGDRRHGLPAN